MVSDTPLRSAALFESELTAGRATTATMARMQMTTSISTRVNPLVRLGPSAVRECRRQTAVDSPSLCAFMIRLSSERNSAAIDAAAPGGWAAVSMEAVSGGKLPSDGSAAESMIGALFVILADDDGCIRGAAD